MRLIEHPQIRDSGILVETDHPQAGPAAAGEDGGAV